MTRPDIPAVLLRDPDPPRWLIVRHETPEAPEVLVGSHIRLGSAQDNELVLRGADIGGRHCTLRRRGNVVIVLDHGAPAGTLLDNRPVQEPRVVSGALRLIVGAHVLTVYPLEKAIVAAGLSRGFWPGHDRPPPSPKAVAPRLSPRAPLGQKLALCGVVLGTAWTTYAAVAPLLAPQPAAASPPTASAQPREARLPRELERRPDKPPRSSTVPGRTSPLAPLNVRRGETWASLAADRGVHLPSLRDANPGLRRPLRAGDRLQLPAPSHAGPRHPPLHDACGDHLEIPGGSRSIGGVNLGELDDPIHLPQLDLYELRCPAHAFATATTTRALLQAIRCFRGGSAYDGQIVIGDISAERGGPLGPHLSHQSGRDVDLWLPIAGGRYAMGCDHCGTSYCRPQPEEVDWSATWRLVDTLAGLPEVEVIFLDFDLQAELRRSALEGGANPAMLDARIQWPRRGAASLVQHADGHIHHIHIRFRCAIGEGGCIGRPSPPKNTPKTLLSSHSSPPQTQPLSQLSRSEREPRDDRPGSSNAESGTGELVSRRPRAQGSAPPSSPW